MSTPGDFERVVDLELAIWGDNPRGTLPASIMRVLTLGGGIIHGAFDKDELVGASIAFPIQREGGWVLWSYLTGVLAGYRNYGIGRQLKLAQRGHALERGFSEIRWTFDPLRRGNAHFNLCHLKAFTYIYHVDFYGALHDQINVNAPSDRVEVIWPVEDNSADPNFAQSGNWALSADQFGGPVVQNLSSGDAYWVEIPADLSILTLDMVMRWRLALRTTMQEAFLQGYQATYFGLQQGRWAYFLQRRS
ncbi:MAG: hypothetical protein SNJ59_13870 [Aggregatilineales bacterium]